MRWAGHAARMRRVELHIWMWWGNLRDRDYFEDLGFDGRIILICSFRKWWDGGRG